MVSSRSGSGPTNGSGSIQWATRPLNPAHICRRMYTLTVGKQARGSGGRCMRHPPILLHRIKRGNPNLLRAANRDLLCSLRRRAKRRLPFSSSRRQPQPCLFSRAIIRPARGQSRGRTMVVHLRSPSLSWNTRWQDHYLLPNRLPDIRDRKPGGHRNNHSRVSLGETDEP
jgi:hypothetical protein